MSSYQLSLTVAPAARSARANPCQPTPHWQELDAAKQANEKHKFLETSKMESERSLLELRQRNDQMMQEVQNLKTQLTSLQQQASQDAANAAAMQTKISSMELASQLQVKHLESVTAQEASLKKVCLLKIEQERGGGYVTGHAQYWSYGTDA